MKHLYVLSLCIFISFTAFSQIKFKPEFEAASGFSKDNFFLANVGLGLEKKIDINKSIQSGMFYHMFEFTFAKDKYGFYNAFVKNTANDTLQDTITDYRVTLNFFSIPIGYSQYISPKTYLTYRLGMNFFTSSTYQGAIIHQYEDNGYLYQKKFVGDIFKKMYFNHTIGINTIILRRIDVGLSFIWTKSNFFKNLNNDIYRSFNNEVSKYFAVGFNLKFFVFQIDSKKI